jgi:hypothetical protein
MALVIGKPCGNQQIMTDNLMSASKNATHSNFNSRASTSAKSRTPVKNFTGVQIFSSEIVRKFRGRILLLRVHQSQNHSLHCENCIVNAEQQIDLIEAGLTPPESEFAQGNDGDGSEEDDKADQDERHPATAEKCSVPLPPHCA